MEGLLAKPGEVHSAEAMRERNLIHAQGIPHQTTETVKLRNERPSSQCPRCPDSPPARGRFGEGNFVGDDGTVNREDKGLLAKLRNVLQDAPQIGWFHFFGQKLNSHAQ